MRIKLFSPENIKPEDYRYKYPELERAEEFANLSPRALIFVWWYANQTSSLVLEIDDDYDRAEEALKRSGYNPGKNEKEAILKLQFNSEMAVAIKKMSEYAPEPRFKAYKMIRTIFDHYENIITQGPDAFKVTEKLIKTKDGEEGGEASFIDYPKYVNVSAKIAEEIPNLLNKLEEGFGIVDISSGEVKEENDVASIRDLHLKRENV